MIQLRDYQQRAVAQIRAAYARKKRAPLLVLPTGGGKTVTFSYVTQSASEKGNCVWLIVHRAELVKQIAMTLARFGCAHQVVAPGPIVRQCQAEQFKTFGRSFVSAASRVFVCSVQTVVKRLAKMPREHFPDLIVVDEAHHLTAGTMWGKVVDAFPNARLLPVTATPCRLDGKGLGVEAGGFCDELVMGPTMAELIAAGALSRYRVFAPPSVVDLSGVGTVAGDYAKGQLAAAVDKPKITGDAVEHYERLTPGKRAVAFCVSVEHSQHVAAAFERAGIPSAFLDGTMDPTERDKVLKEFEAGRVRVLTSCDIISEGFDVPAIEVAILLRPTQSLSLYLQQVGRALRVFPGKTEAIILDHVGAVMTHGLPDEDREWSLDGIKRRPKRKTENNDLVEPGVDSVRTCPKCFTVHAPMPKCPNDNYLGTGQPCGYEYPVAARKVDSTDGELQELTSAQIEAMRRARRVMQGKAQSREELIAQGIAPKRADIILAARAAKQQQIDAVMDRLDAIKVATGKGPYAACGHTLGDIKRMKPKELAGLLSKLSDLVENGLQG
ncbi:MAG TPA: DEAD/DEAH box helicase [Moraxellaceae bacterium]|nr:DEAD/DEAH box helicase [Moraxellaceae bacterium]